MQYDIAREIQPPMNEISYMSNKLGSGKSMNFNPITKVSKASKANKRA